MPRCANCNNSMSVSFESKNRHLISSRNFGDMNVTKIHIWIGVKMGLVLCKEKYTKSTTYFSRRKKFDKFFSTLGLCAV